MLGGMNEEIERVEVKISYLESEVAELNDVVIDQRKEIDQLNHIVEKLSEKVQNLIEEVGMPNRPSTRPPHY